jgi:hypothetical protein
MWKEKFIQGGKQALTRSRRNSGGGELQAENERLKQLICELTIANGAFKKILQGRGEKDGSRHDSRPRTKPQRGPTPTWMLTQKLLLPSQKENNTS